MSVHISTPFQGTAAHLRAGGILGAGDAAGPLANARPLMRLGHVDVEIAIVGDAGLTALRRAGMACRPGINVGPAPGTILDVAATEREHAERPRGGEDPVVMRLSRALEAAETGAGEHCALYADAVRLAIVARMLSLRSGTLDSADGRVVEHAPAVVEARTPEPSEAPAPVTEPRRPKSGLPKWRFKRVAAYVDENLDKPVTLAGMAAAAGLSRMHFAAQFKIATGTRPHDYLLGRRIERAKAMMIASQEPLVEIALAVGFQTQAHFTTVFRRFVGDTPHQWRSANRGRLPLSNKL
jgi:AraC family transcriptional regulator